VSTKIPTHTNKNDLRTEIFTERNLSRECHARLKNNISNRDAIAARR
jgi:hypothetical protein